MPTTRNVLIPFIASPGDLLEERKAAREVVQELNSTFRTIDWEIDLLGFEDTMPGVARPQELINKDEGRFSCAARIGVAVAAYLAVSETDATGNNSPPEKSV